MIRLTPRFTAGDRPFALAPLAKSILPALVFVYLVGPSVLRAQDDALPKAEVILDKYVEVTGGKAAYEKLTNRVTKATLKFPGQGLEFAVTTYAAKPNKLYNLMEAESFGRIEKGTDGDVAWEINVMTGPQIKEGEERAFILRGATFDAATGWRKLYQKAECVGLETIDDTPCYKVVLTPNEGSPETRYYDRESNLVVKSELSVKLPMGAIPIETYASDYRRVDGILLPHKARILVMGMERVMITESVKHNVKVPAERFELPQVIRTLLDEQERQTTAPGTPKKGKDAKPESP